MLYSEFVQGTGCRENDHNYQVYKNLEIMYMNSEMSKQEIYDYGKKLVDNSKSPEQLELEASVKTEIAALQDDLKRYRAEVKRYTEYHKTREDKADTFWKEQLIWSKKMVVKTKNAIDARKLMLSI